MFLAKCNRNHINHSQIASKVCQNVTWNCDAAKHSRWTWTTFKGRFGDPLIHIVNSSVLSAFSICLLSCRPIFQREPTIVLCWWIYSFNHSRIECWWDRWPTGASTFVVVAYSSHKVAVEGRRGLEASSSTPWAKMVQQQAAWRATTGKQTDQQQPLANNTSATSCRRPTTLKTAGE